MEKLEKTLKSQLEEYTVIKKNIVYHRSPCAKRMNLRDTLQLLYFTITHVVKKMRSVCTKSLHSAIPVRTLHGCQPGMIRESRGGILYAFGLLTKPRRSPKIGVGFIGGTRSNSPGPRCQRGSRLRTYKKLIIKKLVLLVKKYQQN